MKFKILIDKSTVKENPGAGSTELLASGAETTVFEIKGFAAFKDNRCILEAIQKYTDKSFIDYDRTFHILTVPLGGGDAYIVHDWIDRNKDVIESVNIKKETNLVRRQTMPQPRYLFEHEPTFVECDSCGARFKHIYLKEEYEYDNTYSNVCPACGEYECCEIEYQGIEEVLKENG
jgi:hypothetical protein